MTNPPGPDGDPLWKASSVRTPRKPIIPRKVWILGTNEKRIQSCVQAIERAGHQVRTAETSGELTPALREFRPDLVVIDMQEEPERGRHVAVQLRADRATRQLPIILVGAGSAEAGELQKQVTGPTRRYRLPMDAPSVLNAIVCEL